LDEKARVPVELKGEEKKQSSINGREKSLADRC
jgi:hypothetical protein